MKKLLAVVLGVVMCLSVSLLAACGSAFDGDYKETSAASVSEFAAKVDEAGLDDISYGSGIKTYLEFETSGDGESMSIKNTMYFALKDNKLAMNGDVSGKVKSSTTNMDVNAKIYYSDGYMYYNGKYMNIDAKFKQAMGIEELIGSYGETGSLSQVKLSDAVVQYTSDTTRFYMTTDNNGVTKIRLNVQSEYGKIAIYYIFGSDYALQGFKMEIETNFEGAKVKGTMYAEPWNGNINLPSDLASYPEGNPFVA